MTGRRPGSLRRRLVGVAMATTLVALLVGLGSLIAYDLRVFHRDWSDDVAAQAALIGRVSTTALLFDDAQAAQANLDLLRLRPPIQAAAIYAADGSLFAGYHRGSDDEPLPAAPGEHGMRVGIRSLALFAAIDSDGERIGTVFLRSDYDIARRITDHVGIGLAIAVLAMLVAWLVTLRLLRVVTDPLLAIAAIAHGVVEHGDYERRAEVVGDDEVGALAAAFNRMLGEIDARRRALQQANAELGREIEERRRAEAQVLRLNTRLEDRVRQRTAELESAIDELEAFSYSVSHDLRAPLRSIDGFSQALQEDHGAALPDEAARYLGRIRAATQRMGQLIDGLLALSRVSRQPLQWAAVDLGELAHRALDELAQSEPQRQVEVRIADGLLANGDPRLLAALVGNLVGNAWKFTSRRADAWIEVGVDRDQVPPVFHVADNGAGFDMRHADKLFGAFQRLHGSEDFAGTGIGLATVRRIVARHGGWIRAEAEVDRGARFRFTLAPATAAAPPAGVAS